MKIKLSLVAVIAMNIFTPQISSAKMGLSSMASDVISKSYNSCQWALDDLSAAANYLDAQTPGTKTYNQAVRELQGAMEVVRIECTASSIGEE